MARPPALKLHPLVSLTLVFGLALSALLFLKAKEWQGEQAGVQFYRSAAELAETFRLDLSQSTETLWAVGGLYAASQEVERDEFHAFTALLLERHPEILSLEWMPRVEGTDRERFEQDLRAQGFPDFEIRDLWPDGKLERASTRNLYFPALFLEPFDRNRSALGFDHASHAARQEAMETARDLGLPISTGRLRLFRLAEGTSEEDRAGYVLFLPVYRNGLPHQTVADRRQNLAGYIAAVFQAVRMAEPNLRRFEHQKMRIRFYSGSREDPEMLLYGAVLEAKPPAQHRSLISTAGEKWLLVVEPPEKAFDDLSSGLPLLVLALALVFTLLLSGIFHNVLGRASLVEQQVTARTAELSREVVERSRLEEELRGKAEQMVQTNKELVHREQLMYSFIEGAPDPIILLDADGRIRSVNLSAQKISGYSDKELVGKPMGDSGVLSKASLPTALKEFGLVLTGAERRPFELVIIAKNGNHLIFEVNPRLIRSGGRTSGVLVIFRDVTERNRLEEQIRQKAYELAGSNEEMKKREGVMRSLLEDLSSSKGRLEETTRQVEGMNKRLQEMAALKDEFVAKVSHELRTPLTSVKEGLNLMLDGALGATTAEQGEFLKTMDGDIDRLSELINNMLDLSKIESGRMRLVRRRMALTDLVRGTVRSYQAIAAGREIVQDFKEAPDVFIDGNRILQVLGNLFSNAIKYGCPGGKITFGVEPAGREVLVTVEDEGEGIPPEDIPKLFQKFSQVGKQNAQQVRGTGLGLVVCKELAEIHGGRIEVSSRVGEGTRFTIHLPAYSDELAIRESFRELREQEPDADALGVGLLAIQMGADSDGAKLPRQELMKAAEEVRRRLHHSDIVLDVEPCWVVALAAVDQRGLEAMVRRLRQSLPGAEAFRLGLAHCPPDGKDGPELFKHALEELGHGVPSRPDAKVSP